MNKKEENQREEKEEEKKRTRWMSRNEYELKETRIGKRRGIGEERGIERNEQGEEEKDEVEVE